MSYCLARTSNHYEAEDLAQDILCEIVHSATSICDDKAFYGFMWAIAHNVYAFLTEPKSELGRLISGAWKKFKKWWDEKHRPEVEAEVRESIMGKLNALKKETEASKKDRKDTIRRKGIKRKIKRKIKRRRA